MSFSDELDALRSIYLDDIFIESGGGMISYSFNSLLLKMYVDEKYPNRAPKIEVKNNEEIQEIIRRKSLELLGQEMLYELIELFKTSADNYSRETENYTTVIERIEIRVLQEGTQFSVDKFNKWAEDKQHKIRRELAGTGKTWFLENRNYCMNESFEAE